MTISTATLTPARALHRPSRRVDLRVVIGIGLAILAFAGSLAFWASTSDSRAVVVAARDLPAGATLAASDLGVARVRMDEPLYAAAVPADALDSLVGQQLTQPLYADQVLARAQLLSDPRPTIGSDQMALTIPVNASTAAGGQLQPGDSVRVLATTNKGKPDAQTSVVLDRALVYDVGHDQSAVISAGTSSSDSATRTVSRGPISSVTLVVSPDQAVALAQARWNGDLDVGLLPPQSAAQPAPR